MSRLIVVKCYQWVRALPWEGEHNRPLLRRRKQSAVDVEPAVTLCTSWGQQLRR